MISFVAASPSINAAIPLDHRRIELHSEAHKANIQPGSTREIPKTSIGIGQQDPNARDGWARQEALQRHIGSAWESGNQSSWQSFTSGKRAGGQAARGSVEVDGAAHKQASVATAPRFEQAKSGWERLKMAFQSAAEFEETQRGGRSAMGFGGRVV
ncbi:MAG: hypothetical protein HY791_21430 [Deltaproteobacteria bacterium]|nr:hypothetical protein [Deltaproteobacteria bacterium]